MRKIIVRTHRVPPTSTKGTKIHVHVEGRQITYRFPYEEGDPHLWAASCAVRELGIGNPDDLLLDGTLSNGYRYALTVEDTEPNKVQTRTSATTRC